jgi:hypothetical protein
MTADGKVAKETLILYVIIEDLTEVNMKSNPSILCDMIPCTLVDVYQYFGGMYFFHLGRSHSSCCLLPACSAHTSTMIIGVVSSPEISLNFYQITRRQIQEYRGNRRNVGHNFIVNISTLSLFSVVVTSLVLMHDGESEIYFHEQRTACRSLIGRFCVIHQVTTASFSD